MNAPKRIFSQILSPVVQYFKKCIFWKVKHCGMYVFLKRMNLK